MIIYDSDSLEEFLCQIFVVVTSLWNNSHCLPQLCNDKKLSRINWEPFSSVITQKILSLSLSLCRPTNNRIQIQNFCGLRKKGKIKFSPLEEFNWISFHKSLLIHERALQ